MTGSQADAAAARDAQRTQKNKREMRLHKAGRCVDWKKNKGVVGGIRDAIRPTTEEKAFLLALYEMTRLICINKYGADRSFSI